MDVHPTLQYENISVAGRGGFARNETGAGCSVIALDAPGPEARHHGGVEGCDTVEEPEQEDERFTVRGHQKDTITLAHSLDENDKEKTLDFVEGYVVEPDGIEPTTSGLQSPRSPS